MFAKSGEMTPPCGVPESGVANAPFLHHAGVEPLAHQSNQHSIAYPLAEYLLKLGAIDGIEESLDIRLQHPTSVHSIITSRKAYSAWCADLPGRKPYEQSRKSCS